MARPTDDRRDTKAAFEAGALGAFEWSLAAIRPGEYLGSVVGGENDDGVVSLADVLQVLQDLADTVVHLRHTRFFQSIVTAIVHHRLILGRDIGKDVHAGSVVPDEERLAI